MRIQSCFVDETGRQGMEDGHYLLTLVLHDQSISIEPRIAAYEARLAYEGLRDIPFHAVDLLHGRERYANESAAAAMRYEQAAVSATYARFYGASRNFKQNFLKQARRKRIGRP